MDSYKSKCLSKNSASSSKPSRNDDRKRNCGSQVKKEEHAIDDHENDDTLEYELLEKDYSHPPPTYSKGDFKADSSDEDTGDEDNGDNDGQMALDQRKRKGADTDADQRKFRQITLPSAWGKGPSRNSNQEDRLTRSRYKRWNDEDTENYRNGYPGQKDDPHLNDNHKFYTGQIPSYPDGNFIDNIHKEWFGNYKLLERHHGYIQWLFPIRESGMNFQAQPLQLHEAKAIQNDREARNRVLKSFRLMLDFYGMTLDDEATGKFSRSKNWKQRYENLNWSSHNYLRITRILKSLGEFGFEHLKVPFLEFIITEAIIHDTLKRTLKSCKDYWIGTVKNDKDRAELYEILNDADFDRKSAR